MHEPVFRTSRPAATFGLHASGEPASPPLVQRRIPLILGNELQTLLHPTNRLIYSPHTLDQALLQPFREGTKTLILINAQNGKALPATLQALHSSYLIADTQHSMFRRKPGEAMLVVFPLAAHQHCVLQTTIHRVYAFRLELEYQDPRYDVRHTIPLSSPVTLSPVPTTMVMALEQNQGRLVRQIALTPRTPHGTMRRLITDLFYPQDALQPAPAQGSDSLVLPCALHDISLGGACLAVHNPSLVDSLMHRLVHLTMSFPCASQTLPDWAYVSLHLQVLGIVRGSSNATAPRALHIRFLKRLLPDVDPLFWHLEGNMAQGGES
ncbi:MAG: hypothetical protein AB7N91_00715 [Candidatus Tectimicrobiota bacterium]